MARIVESITVGVTRNSEGNIANVRYLAPGSMFGTSTPDHLDALIIEHNGPWWLGHAVNLDVDGDEIILNCKMGGESITNQPGNENIMDQIAEFVKDTGMIEISENVMCPDSLEYTNIVHEVKTAHYNSDFEYVMECRAPAGTKVY